MEKEKKVAVLFAMGIIGVWFLFIAITSPPKLVGFVIYENSCEGIINSSGFWELNDSLSCASSGVTINSSNVILSCESYPLTGNNESDSIGIKILENLSNVSVLNCNITQFETAVFIGENSEAEIKDTHIEAENCVEGNYTDAGGNSGCLSPKFIMLSVENQTIYENESFIYQIEYFASSINLTFSLDDSSQNFSINGSGTIVNATLLLPSNYTINITVNDSEGLSDSESFNLEVLDIPENSSQSSTSQSEEDDEDEDSEESEKDKEKEKEKSPVAGGGPQAKICGGSAWKCSEWSSCIDGKQTRICAKTNLECSDALPSTTQSCSVETSANNDCIPEWQCETLECYDGSKAEFNCVDRNNCGLAHADTECPSLEQTSRLTGNAVSFLEDIGLKFNLETIKKNLVLPVAILLGAFLLAMIVMHRRAVIRSQGSKLISKKHQAGSARAHKKSPRHIKETIPITPEETADDRQKLWEWEEHN